MHGIGNVQRILVRETSEEVDLVPMLRKESIDLRYVPDLHREEEVGFVDVVPVETTCTMSVPR